MEFYLYNSLTRKKELLTPISGNSVGIYSCGPTVHNFAHIGNLRKYIMDDVLAKALMYTGYRVRHVMNITDVGHLQSDADEGEDKMLLSSLREKRDVITLARQFEEIFFEDCAKLNIARPQICCRATEHIDDMIALIQRLTDMGYTYFANGNVYFDVSRFKRYHEFARLNLKDLRPGSRIEVDSYKRNPYDFVLWFTNSKFENHILEWQSPWGQGYPGWHIECSAMALKYLGDFLDIHTGGIDHIPVHHTNEIAQSEAVLGHKWVNYWVHSEFLVVEGEKMSKSKGEFLTLQRLCDNGFSPMDYRFFCLQSRYRQQLIYRDSSIKNARDSLLSLYEKVNEIYQHTNLSITETIESIRGKAYESAFLAQISDDLNTPNTLTVLHDVIKDNELNNETKIKLINQFDKVLSLNLLKPISFASAFPRLPEAEIQKMLLQRNEAREKKDYQTADSIRDKLFDMNVILIDTADGTKWAYKDL